MSSDQTRETAQDLELQSELAGSSAAQTYQAAADGASATSGQGYTGRLGSGGDSGSGGAGFSEADSTEESQSLGDGEQAATDQSSEVAGASGPSGGGALQVGGAGDEPSLADSVPVGSESSGGPASTDESGPTAGQSYMADMLRQMLGGEEPAGATAAEESPLGLSVPETEAPTEGAAPDALGPSDATSNPLTAQAGTDPSGPTVDPPIISDGPDTGSVPAASLDAGVLTEPVSDASEPVGGGDGVVAPGDSSGAGSGGEFGGPAGQPGGEGQAAYQGSASDAGAGSPAGAGSGPSWVAEVQASMQAGDFESAASRLQDVLAENPAAIFDMAPVADLARQQGLQINTGSGSVSFEPAVPLNVPDEEPQLVPIDAPVTPLDSPSADAAGASPPPTAVGESGGDPAAAAEVLAPPGTGESTGAGEAPSGDSPLPADWSAGVEQSLQAGDASSAAAQLQGALEADPGTVHDNLTQLADAARQQGADISIGPDGRVEVLPQGQVDQLGGHDSAVAAAAPLATQAVDPASLAPFDAATAPHLIQGHSLDGEQQDLVHRNVLSETALKQGEGGVNATVKVEMDGNQIGYAKSQAGVAPQHQNMPDYGQFWNSELGAYTLDRHLGYGLVPTTAPYSGMDGSRGPGTIQAAVSGDAMSSTQFDALDQQKAAVLDYLMGQGDRNPGNVLGQMTPEEAAAAGVSVRPAMIDNGWAFPERDSENTQLRSDFVVDHLNQPLDQSILDGLGSLDRGSLASGLSDAGLNQSQIDGVMNRLSEIVNNGKITGRSMSDASWVRNDGDGILIGMPTLPVSTWTRLG